MEPSDESIVLSRRVVDGGVEPVGADGGVMPNTVRFFEECARTDCFEQVFTDDTELLETCMHDCIDLSVVAPLSHGCRDCYVEEVACAIQNCLLPCSGTDSSLCDACVDDTCNERLIDCIGY